MGVIDGIGKAIKILQKAGQIEVISDLIDVQQKVLEMQENYIRLQRENDDLKSMRDLEADIVRHELGYITRKSEEGKNLFYCGSCWGKHQKLIPLVAEPGYYPKCADTNCKVFYYFLLPSQSKSN